MCRTAPGPQCLLPACLNHDGISSLPQTSVRSAFRGAQTSLTVPIIRLVLKVTDSWREGACFPLRLEEAPLRLEHTHSPREQPGVWGPSRRLTPAPDGGGGVNSQGCRGAAPRDFTAPWSACFQPEHRPTQAGYEPRHTQAGTLPLLGGRSLVQVLICITSLRLATRPFSCGLSSGWKKAASVDVTLSPVFLRHTFQGKGLETVEHPLCPRWGERWHGCYTCTH